MLQGTGDTNARSKRLRQEMSLPEILLWQALQTRPAGLKFRKQQPAGPYTADFYCHQARFIVEVDSEAHERGDRPERDEARDRWFAARRLRTFRVPAKAVLTDMESVVHGIVAFANPPLEGEVARAARRRAVTLRQAETPLHHRAAPGVGALASRRLAKAPTPPPLPGEE